MKKECKITVIILSSLFLLGACSKNEKATSASSSHAKVIRTSNSVAEKKTVKSSISSNRESTVSTSSVTEIETAEVEVTEKAETVPSQQQQSCTNDDSLNFEQIAYGDFSSLSGTWTNDLGESITLTQGGQVSLSQSQALYQITTNIVKDDVYFGTIYNPNSMTDSAAFIVVPKGVADPFLGEVGATDRLIVGQCGSASEHPFLKN